MNTDIHDFVFDFKQDDGITLDTLRALVKWADARNLPGNIPIHVKQENNEGCTGSVAKHIIADDESADIYDFI